MVCQEDGHTQEVCPNQKCRTCGKLGHGTRDCPNLVVSKNLSQPNFARKNNGKIYLILNHVCYYNLQTSKTVTVKSYLERPLHMSNSISLTKRHFTKGRRFCLYCIA